MDSISRRGLLQNVALLAGLAATPHGSALALFQGPASLPGDTMALLTAFADTLLPTTDTPGAAEAGVPRGLEKLLANWASPSRRTEILGALAEIDKQSISASASAFAESSPTERLVVLSAFDKAHIADPGYAKLKELTITLYYLSEVGATQELRYEHSPGAWEPSIPVTPETRNYGGPGL